MKETIRPPEWDALPWILSLNHVVQVTGLTPKEIYRATESGALKCHRPRRKRRFFKADVMAFCRVTTYMPEPAASER